jgi:predicted heme/steroid binding protein
MNQIELSLEELRLFDGKDGRKAYVAFGGKVYDVTASYSWRNGAHQVLHLAGCDLTLEMKDAPHGEDLLIRFPVIGVLHKVDYTKIDQG